MYKIKSTFVYVKKKINNFYFMYHIYLKLHTINIYSNHYTHQNHNKINKPKNKVHTYHILIKPITHTIYEVYKQTQQTTYYAHGLAMVYGKLICQIR